MHGPDVVGAHATLSTDFVNEPRDKPRDGHAHFIHVSIVGGTLRIQTVTLRDTAHTHAHTHTHTRRYQQWLKCLGMQENEVPAPLITGK